MNKLISPKEEYVTIGWDKDGNRVDITLSPAIAYPIIDSHMHMRRIMHDGIYAWIDKDRFRLAE